MRQLGHHIALDGIDGTTTSMVYSALLLKVHCILILPQEWCYLRDGLEPKY